MNDFWPRYRLGPQSQALHCSYEQAGLTLCNQPIPWNAESVIVEAFLRLPLAARRKADFGLRLAGREPVGAESLRRNETDDRYHLFFRFPPPPATTTAELLWRGHALGQLTLPIIDAATFIQGLQLQLPILAVRLGEQYIACETYVANQCRGLLASAVVTSPTGLSPLAQLGLTVEFCGERGSASSEVSVPLCTSQLSSRQALVVAEASRPPKRTGEWTATWRAGDQTLATQRVRAITQSAFVSSLRVVDTRIVVESGKGEVALRRQPPRPGEATRIGPAFFIASREPGMAGLVKLQIHAQVPGAMTPPIVQEQTIVVTDGPTLFAPGLLDASEAGHATSFELRRRGTLLGTLSLCPTPTANFTPEGGFEPPSDFAWTPSAEDELSERLSKLIDGPRG
jgi:hypothetical protein